MTSQAEPSLPVRVGVALAAALIASTAAGAIAGVYGAVAMVGPPDASTFGGFVVVVIVGAFVGALAGIPIAWFAALLWALAMVGLPASLHRGPAGPLLGALAGAAAMTVAYLVGRALRVPQDFSQWPEEYPWLFMVLAALAGVFAALLRQPMLRAISARQP